MRTLWTDDQVETLRINYAGWPTFLVAFLCGHDVASTRQKASSLGLKKNPDAKAAPAPVAAAAAPAAKPPAAAAPAAESRRPAPAKPKAEPGRETVEQWMARTGQRPQVLTQYDISTPFRTIGRPQ